MFIQRPRLLGKYKEMLNISCLLNVRIPFLVRCVLLLCFELWCIMRIGTSLSPPSHFPSSINANDVFKFPEVIQEQGRDSQLHVVLLSGERQSEVD
jgi:hypothetical protein